MLYVQAKVIFYRISQTDMSSVVEEVNDKHMGPWAEACNKDGVENSPLSPYIDQELLYNKHLYLEPGKLLSTGFTYLYPKLTKDVLKEVNDYLNKSKNIISITGSALSIFPEILFF